MKSLPATDICLYFVRQDTVYSYLRIYVRCRHTAPTPIRLSTAPLFSLFPTPPDALRSPCKCTDRAFIVAFCIHNIVLCDFFAFFRSPLRPQDHPLLQASPPLSAINAPPLLQASPPCILRQIFCLSPPPICPSPDGIGTARSNRPSDADPDAAYPLFHR